MPDFTGISISQDGYNYLFYTLGFNNNDNYYYDNDEGCWFVNYEELMAFLESQNLMFNEETYSIYWANMQPSQKAIFIGVD